MQAHPKLKISHLQKSFANGRSTIKVLDDINLEVGDNEFVSLVGASGCGKSTLLSILGGLLRPSAGVAELRGAPPPDSFNPLTFVFQDFALLPWCTVAENVEFPLLHTGLASGERRAIVDDALRRTGLSDFRSTYPKQLSGGMRQRASIARALVMAPKLLLMDEPTAGMAPRERIELMRLTAQIAREKSIGVLFTEHDMDVVFEHADRILVLDRGSLIAEGSPQQVRSNPQVRAIYLGEGLLTDPRHREGAPS